MTETIKTTRTKRSTKALKTALTHPNEATQESVKQSVKRTIKASKKTSKVTETAANDVALNSETNASSVETFNILKIESVNSIVDTLKKNKSVKLNHHAFPETGEKPVVELINMDDVYVIKGVQRDPIVTHIQNIAQNFRYSKAKPATAVRWRGRIMLGDGQHTSIAMAVRGMKNIWAYVIDVRDSATEQEVMEIASTQLLSVNDQKPIESFYIYQNKLIQGLPTEVAMDAIVSACGVTVGSRKDKNKAGCLTDISTLRTISKYPKDDAITALKFIRSNWPNEPVEGKIFYGLTHLFSNYESSRKFGRPNTTIDPWILHQAMSDSNKMDTQKRILRHLELEKLEEYGDSESVQKIETVKWLPKMLVEMYNKFIAIYDLDESKLLDESVR